MMQSRELAGLDGAVGDTRQSRREADPESFSRKKDQEAGRHSLLEADQGREPRRSKNHDDGIAQQKDSRRQRAPSAWLHALHRIR